MQRETLSLLNKRNQERELVCEILKELIVVQQKQVYLLEGCSSMFTYCTEIMGYSEDEAYIRMQAMRGLRANPAIETKLESGELKLTVVAKAQAAIRRAEKVRKVSREEKSSLFDSLCGATVREANLQIATALPESVVPIERIQPVTEELTKIEYYADKRLLAKLERLKGLLAHKNYEGRHDVLIEQLADIALAKLDPKNSDAAIHVSNGGSRYIGKGTKRMTWTAAEGRCQYINPITGKRCTSKHGLQIHHVHEYANGGSNDPKNLQLLCGPHNRWRSRL